MKLKAGDRPRVVMDTNTLVRGLANADSPSGTVVDMCAARQVTLLLSKSVISEYQRVLRCIRVIQHAPELTDASADLTIRKLRYVSEYIRNVNIRFPFPRDPKDERFIQLAIAGSATDIVTHDRDLFSLQTGHFDEAGRLRRRLPGLAVLTAHQFIQWVRQSPGMEQ